MDVATSTPVTLVAVVGAEDDEEGDGGDEHADAVGVFEHVIVGVEVVLDVDEEEGGDEGGDEGAVDG